MSNYEIPVKIVTQREISCSFCQTKLRQDVRDDEREYENAKYNFQREACQKGWRSGKTQEGYELTFCIDHVSTGKEMGIIQ